MVHIECYIKRDNGQIDLLEAEKRLHIKDAMSLSDVIRELKPTFRDTVKEARRVKSQKTSAIVIPNKPKLKLVKE